MKIQYVVCWEFTGKMYYIGELQYYTRRLVLQNVSFFLKNRFRIVRFEIPSAQYRAYLLILGFFSFRVSTQ